MDIFYVVLCIAGLLSIVVVFLESDMSPAVLVVLLVFTGCLYLAAISAVSSLFVSAEDTMSRVLSGVVKWMLPSIILVGDVLYLRWRKQVSEDGVDENSEGGSN